jgi:hypothetical protein
MNQTRRTPFRLNIKPSFWICRENIIDTSKSGKGKMGDLALKPPVLSSRKKTKKIPIRNLTPFEFNNAINSRKFAFSRSNISVDVDPAHFVQRLQPLYWST